MRKLTLTALVVILCWAMSAPVSADFKKTKIAVLDFSLKGKGYETDDMGAIVAEWFITALVKEGRFDVIERSLLNKILSEQKLGMTGIIDETTATRIGKLLGVKVIISGSVLKLQDVLEINSRIIDVETASIIAAENVKSSAAVRLQDLVVQMAAKIIKNFPLEGYIVSRNREADTAAIDLGRLAGVKSHMNFEVFREGKVIKHPKTGEVLDVERIITGRLVVVEVRDNIAKGRIIEESRPGAIRFGQRVKSLGPLTPVEPVHTLDSAVQRVATETRPKRQSKPETVADLKVLLGSSNPEDIRTGARYTVRLYPQDPELLTVAAEQLLKRYQEKSKNRYFSDAMAWLCNVLGRSGDKSYAETLKTVADSAEDRKIKKYAKRNYKLLR